MSSDCKIKLDQNEKYVSFITYLGITFPYRKKRKICRYALTKVTKMGTVYSGNFCPNSNGTQKCRNKISEILQYGQFHLTTEDSQILNRNFDKMESAH